MSKPSALITHAQMHGPAHALAHQKRGRGEIVWLDARSGSPSPEEKAATAYVAPCLQKCGAGVCEAVQRGPLRAQKVFEETELFSGRKGHYGIRSVPAGLPIREMHLSTWILLMRVSRTGSP